MKQGWCWCVKWSAGDERRYVKQPCVADAVAAAAADASLQAVN